jgi:hypothetical protein
MLRILEVQFRLFITASKSVTSEDCVSETIYGVCAFSRPKVVGLMLWELP